jgi:hypothetical protein
MDEPVLQEKRTQSKQALINNIFIKKKFLQSYLLFGKEATSF